MQKIYTPEIINCHCLSPVKILVLDDGYENIYRVECSNGHSLTKYCGTPHRAICRWNNSILKINKNKNEQSIRIK